jgi:hypothetical protein
MTTSTHRLGKTRAGERSRVWLEGKKLESTGFTQGTLFSKEWLKGKLVIERITQTTFDKLAPINRGTVSGSIGRPVIDITGEKVQNTFKGDTVTATFAHRCITVEG